MLGIFTEKWQQWLITHSFSGFNIIQTQSSSDRLSQMTGSHILTAQCYIHLSVRRGLNQEAERCTWDPTSSHDLRKWERGAHRDGQHAAEWGEQTAPGYRQAPGPHTCHRRLCHPGGSRAVPRVCKCLISALLAARHDKQPQSHNTLQCARLQGAVSRRTQTLCYYEQWQLAASVWFTH